MKTDHFQKRNEENIDKMSRDPHLKELSQRWMDAVLPYEYHYHFTWMGLPIIQFPSDIVAVQEVVWKVKPDLIVEIGIARGGSLIFYSSILELIGNGGHVVGVDIDIRRENRQAVEQHPMSRNISMIEGSSIDAVTVNQVFDSAKDKHRVMVVLDSNHTHEHVLHELRLYAPLVAIDSYLIVFDTIIEHIPEEMNSERPWGKNNSPKTAVHEFLDGNPNFVIDQTLERKSLVTVFPDGLLKRVK